MTMLEQTAFERRAAMLEQAVLKHDRLEDLLESLNDSVGRGELGHAHEDAQAIVDLLDGR